jgi:hypothetical protein
MRGNKDPTYMELKKMSEFGQFTVKVFIHSVETFLKLFFGEFAHRIMCGIMVNIGQENSLRERRFYVLS